MQWFSGAEHDPFEMHAAEYGPRAAATDAVLLIHGFMGTPAEMRPLGRALAEAGVNARGMLLPGFGSDVSRLGHVTRAEWLTTARDAWRELMREHERVSVIGFSMGGAVALHLAAEVAIHRLVLIAPLSRLLGGHPMLRLLPLARRVVREVKPFQRADFSEPAVREFFGGSLPDLDIDDPRIQERLRSEVRLPTATVDELRLLAQGGERAAGRISIPTLIVQSQNDTVINVRDTARLAGSIPGPVTLHQIRGDHLLVRDDRESWESVRDLVTPFVAGGAPVLRSVA
jgi:carboxylesterase